MPSVLVLHPGLSTEALHELIPSDLRGFLNIRVSVNTMEFARAQIGYYDPEYIVLLDLDIIDMPFPASGVSESRFLGKPRIFVFLTKNPIDNNNMLDKLRELLCLESI